MLEGTPHKRRSPNYPYIGLRKFGTVQQAIVARVGTVWGYGIWEETVHKRIMSMLVAVAIMLLAVPLVATAATPDIARISATSYKDLSRSRTAAALCARDDAGTPSILTTVRYSGTGEDLGGNGTGVLNFAISGSTFEMSGEVVVNRELKTITGSGTLSCLFGGLAVVSGQFVAEGESGTVYGNLMGSITDGAHPSQGSVSLTLTQTEAPEEEPATTSLDILVTLDGAPVEGQLVTIYEGEFCSSGSSQSALTGADGVASFEVTADTLYCAEADPNNDLISTTVVTSVAEGDPVDVDETIAETSTAVTSVDALVTLDGAPAEGVTVSLSGYFMMGGGCLTPIATAVTDATGVASFTNELTSDGWCVSADPDGDGTPTQVIVDMNNVPAGDPVDVDATIAETSQLFVDIVVTLDGIPAVGVTVSLCLTFACTPTTQTALTDLNGRATFNDPLLFTAGESVTASANADGLGAPTTTTFVLPASDPAGDTDATLEDMSPPV